MKKNRFMVYGRDTNGQKHEIKSFDTEKEAIHYCASRNYTWHEGVREGWSMGYYMF